MTLIEVVKAIKAMFHGNGNPDAIPSLRGGMFKAELFEEGVKVLEPGGEYEIVWSEFQEAVDVMAKGLREAGFYITTVKGLPSFVVYGAQLGHPVYDKIAQLIAILIWSGICRLESGFLILNV